MLLKLSRHCRHFVEACNSGAKYLKSNHPDIAKDLSAMCAGLQKTFHTLAVASGVVTNFQFVTSGSAVDFQPDRFNEHFVKHKARALDLKIQLKLH